ncbi:putative UTP-monosaccharide-1-phosphate uridylyltransferase [Helianthus annuus]|nr:putative UTP-monosaccharide-1-phosphate uridylyltransferase [Helianthus annuus]
MFQEKVAWLADNDARLSLEPNYKYRIQVKFWCIKLHTYSNNVFFFLFQQLHLFFSYQPIIVFAIFQQLHLLFLTRQNLIVMAMFTLLFIQVVF